MIQRILGKCQTQITLIENKPSILYLRDKFSTVHCTANWQKPSLNTTKYTAKMLQCCNIVQVHCQYVTRLLLYCVGNILPLTHTEKLLC
jgi:hypothetical protein